MTVTGYTKAAADSLLAGKDAAGAASAAQAAAIAAAATDATTKANAAQAAATAAIPSMSTIAADPALRAAYVAVIGLGNGADDTAAINALLSAARTAGGGLVKGLPGQTYRVSAPLVVGSYTTLDMTGCTVRLVGTASNLLNNYAITAARSVKDAAITSGATALTSGTAAFTSADVGKEVQIYGAGIQGGAILNTTITAVGSGTSATLAVAAGATVTAQAASIGPRDKRITIIGGTWDRAAVADTGTLALHNLMFRRIDGLQVRGVRVTSTTGKYAINPGDCTSVVIDDVDFDTYSDGVHLNGPIVRGVISKVRGSTGDDAVSITPNDYPQYNDVIGDVYNVTVENVQTSVLGIGAGTGVTFAGVAVKVLGGNGCTTKHIRIKRVYADVINSADSAVWIGDDSGTTQTSGGLIDDVTVEDVSWAAPAGRALVKILGTNIKTVKVRGLHLRPAPGGGEVYGVWVPSQTPLLDTLMVSEVTTDSGLSGFASVVRIDAAVVTNLTIDKVAGAAMPLVLDMRGSSPRQPGVTRLAISHVELPSASLIGHNAGANSAATMPWVQLSDIHVAGGNLPIGDVHTTSTFLLSNVRLLPGAQAFNLPTGAAVTVLGSGVDVNGKLAQGAGTLACRSLGVPFDVSQATSKTTGDLAFNTNGALACGVGPVGYTGTAWKNLISGATY